jgi:hypothetical protein
VAEFARGAFDAVLRRGRRRDGGADQRAIPRRGCGRLCYIQHRGNTPASRCCLSPDCRDPGVGSGLGVERSGRGVRTPASCKLGAVSSHEITQLIHEFGLVAVCLAAGLQAMGFPVPGGTALVVAGIDTSSRNGLPLDGVIAAGALGAMCGGTAGFAVGRWRGEPVLLRIGRLLRQQPERVEELRGRFQRNAIAPLFIARFVTGLRSARSPSPSTVNGLGRGRCGLGCRSIACRRGIASHPPARGPKPLTAGPHPA